MTNSSSGEKVETPGLKKSSESPGDKKQSKSTPDSIENAVGGTLPPKITSTHNHQQPLHHHQSLANMTKSFEEKKTLNVQLSDRKLTSELINNEQNSMANLFVDNNDIHLDANSISLLNASGQIGPANLNQTPRSNVSGGDVIGIRSQGIQGQGALGMQKAYSVN